MNMKSFLLSTSALATAVVIGTAAQAGSVGSKDAMSVSLGGELRFYAGMVDQDVSAGRGRGYSLNVDEAEVFVEASNTADNGILYGVSFELNAGAADNTAADEAYAFIDSEVWGRLELGDNDDATDRMYVESDDALVGRLGPDGDAADYFNFGGAIGATGNSVTGDATKATYISPSFSGFQIGASLTPDSGQNSGSIAVTDADGNFENVMSYGIKYAGKFDEIGVSASFTGLNGTDEDANGSAQTTEDANIWAIGGKVDFSGFSLAANFVDFDESGITTANANNGADAGSTWSVGVSYAAGPWGVSAWYLDHQKDNATTSAAGARESELTRIGFGVGYTVAPGWKLTGDVEIFSHDNISANGAGTTTDNDGRGFMLNNQFSF